MIICVIFFITVKKLLLKLTLLYLTYNKCNFKSEYFLMLYLTLYFYYYFYMLDIIKHRYVNISIAVICFVLSVLILIFWEKNYGIDMTWGTQSEYSYSGEIDLENILSGLDQKRHTFNQENHNIINGLSAYQVSGEDKIVVEVWFNTEQDEKTLETFKTTFQSEVGNYLKEQNESFVLYKYTNIGKSFWDYIKKTAFFTLAISLLGITVYVGFAFYGVAVWVPALSFATIVLFTQFIDVIVASGLYVLTGLFYSEFKIDTFFITALLTILGFSINNTIVVFDRVRENIKQFLKTKKLAEIINISINETITRSIYTSLTLVFVLVTIYFFGPETLKWFMLVMIFWVFFGTFSSVWVAGAILYEMNKNQELKIYEKKVVTAEDKIVV